MKMFRPNWLTQYKLKMKRNINAIQLPDAVPPHVRVILSVFKKLYENAGPNEKKIYDVLPFFLKNIRIYSYKIDDENIVFLPILPFQLFVYYFVYGKGEATKEPIPQTVAIIGDRYSGKTITSFTLALSAMKLLNCKVYIYGDVDYLGELLSRMDQRVVWHRPDDYSSLPPIDGKPKIILFNELGLPQYSKSSMTSSSIETDFLSFRARHYDAWIIYNVVYYPGFQSSKKGSNYIEIFKRISLTSTNTIEKTKPPGLDRLVSIANRLDKSRALIMGDIPKIGETAFLTEINPPRWLLKAHRMAKARRHLEMLMLKSQKEKAIVEEIAKLKESGLTNKEIQLALAEKFGVTVSARTIQRRYKTWKMIKGLEG